MHRVAYYILVTLKEQFTQLTKQGERYYFYWLRINHFQYITNSTPKTTQSVTTYFITGKADIRCHIGDKKEKYNVAHIMPYYVNHVSGTFSESLI